MPPVAEGSRPRRPLTASAAPVAALARAIALALVLAAPLAGCTNVFLQPDRREHLPQRPLGTAAEALRIPVTDTETLSALWLPTPTPARAHLLFLHGNAENLSSHVHAVTWLPAAGYAVLAIDYRGYGRSDGVATLDHAQADAAAGLRWLAERDPQTPIIVFGQSLGAAIGLHLAATTPLHGRIAAVVADSGFAGYRRIAREKLAAFWLTWPLQGPLSWTISDRDDPQAVIHRIAPIPLLLIHGERDAVIPPAHADTLLARAGEPKTLWRLPAGQHIDSMRRDEIRERLKVWLDAATAARPEASTAP